MSKIKQRVVTNWKSTAFSLVIIAVCCASVFTGYATWSDVAGFLTTAGVFAWAKDTIFKP
jgi:hypothetical protein